MSRAQSQIRSGLQIVIGGQLVAFGIATYNGNENWYSKILMPLLQTTGAETAHNIAVKAAKYGIVPRIKYTDPSVLHTQVWGQEFINPIGLAAGFDKHAECYNSMFRIGFGFVEVGSVTPEPQPGNPKPRVFRLKQDQAVINRYGFNSDGHEVVFNRLKDRDKSKLEHRVLGVNLGKNKTSEDAVADYVQGVKKFGAFADYLVINVSSPNTPGLRQMQGREQLQKLVTKVLEERNALECEHKPPLLVKIAPDLSEQDKIDIAAVVARPMGGVDGLIVTNTTISRPESLQSKHKAEAGGLSGRPLKDMATQTIRDMYKLTQGRIPIIGVGGVSSGEDAMEKIKAGASLVQLYTAMAYHGPPLVTRIKKDLAKLLEQEGYSSVSDAVGADFKPKTAPSEEQGDDAS